RNCRWFGRAMPSSRHAPEVLRRESGLPVPPAPRRRFANHTKQERKMSTVARSEEETETVRAPRAGANDRPPSRKRSGVSCVVIVVVLALVFGVQRCWWGRSHESTDDAQVDGHIIPVLSKVGGYVATVRVIENSRVRAGDTLATLDERDLRAALD